MARQSTNRGFSHITSDALGPSVTTGRSIAGGIDRIPFAVDELIVSLENTARIQDYRTANPGLFARLFRGARGSQAKMIKVEGKRMIYAFHHLDRSFQGIEHNVTYTLEREKFDSLVADLKERMDTMIANGEDPSERYPGSA